MNITIINGQNHKGTTYHIGKMLADKLGGKVTEFFLPKDFNSFCIGCNNCFMKSEKMCPHHKSLEPVTKAIDDADVIILTSPVYVYHTTGAMKALLDHYGYRWMVHRPNGKMFTKQAVCISTAAGAGMKSTNKDMADSLFFWGVAKIYKLGYAVRAISYNEVNEKILAKIDKDTSALANKIKSNCGKVKPNIKTKCFFEIMSIMNKGKGMNESDNEYWKANGWTENIRPWKNT